MARDLNSVTLSGNITRDLVVKALPSGAFVAEFSLANNGYSKAAGPTVDYFDLVAYGKLAEVLSERVGKGTPIVATGRLKQDRWESNGQKRSRVRMIVDTVKFYGDKGAARADADHEEDPFGDE